MTSETETITPLSSLPTTQDTVKATEEIDSILLKRAAATAVKELAYRIINAVREVDTTHDVAKYINSLTLQVNGTGSFKLNIDHRDNGIVPDDIQQEVMAMIADPDYHKPPRDIRLGKDHAPGPDSST